ncbi:MAG: NAD-dependent epimerase/dehydratase family protein [Terriglobia bacterium]
MDDILVVGASGFVGSQVAEYFLSEGRRVTALDVVPPPMNIPLVRADITDFAALQAALAGRSFDRILHFASLPGDTGDPQQMARVNVVGCLNILEAARRMGKVRRFVLASSISAYEWYPATKFNPPDYLPVDENHPCRPKDMYSTTKHTQEHLVDTYFHQYKLPTTIVRLTAVVGPHGKGGGRGWRTFAEELAGGKHVRIPHLTAEELCHYVDVRDVARMFLVASEHPRAVGEVFNCCGPSPIRGAEFIQIVQRVFPGITVEVGFPWSMAQGGQIAFSMCKAQKLLGFQPLYTMEQSIQNIKDWIDAGGLEEEPAAVDRTYGLGLAAKA